MTTRKLLTLVNGTIQGIPSSDSVDPGAAITFSSTVTPYAIISMEDDPVPTDDGTPIVLIGQTATGDGSVGGAVAVIGGTGGEGGLVEISGGASSLTHRKAGDVIIRGGDHTGTPIAGSTGGSVQLFASLADTNGHIDISIDGFFPAITISPTSDIIFDGYTSVTIGVGPSGQQNRIVADLTKITTVSDSIDLEDNSGNLAATLDTSVADSITIVATENISFTGRVVKNGTTLADTDATINVSTDSFFVMPDNTLSAGRSVTLGTTGVEDLIILVIERIDTNAFNLEIDNGGTNNGVLMTIPSGTSRHVVFQYDGVSGDWVVSSWYNT